MANIIVFNATERGFSHIKTDKPCQDYSLSYQNETGELQIAIVCDGHGSDTYVRSDVGSRLAAEVTFSALQSFIKEVPNRLFLDKKAAVTARPDLSVTIHQKPVKRQDELTEIDKQRIQQEKEFNIAVSTIPEQDRFFTHLFGNIYSQWLDAIEKDASENPFSADEKLALGNNKLVKAYGSTLMAYVRTPLYWFAFHIGDGKLMACDEKLVWSEPVPWDYKCFLNLTTSLCDSNPIPAFRYAFSGCGDFPSAVILGSDGLDDSWGNFERLANFYSQTLCIFEEEGHETAAKELKDYLPKLSEKASRDDMSMAGIIDMDSIKAGCSLYKKRREIKQLEEEKIKRENEVKKIEEELDSVKTSIEEANKRIQETESKCMQLFSLHRKEEECLRQAKEQLAKSQAKYQNIHQNLQIEKSAYEEWEKQANNDYSSLVESVKKQEEEIDSHVKSAKDHWQDVKDRLLNNSGNEQQMTIKQVVVDEEKSLDELANSSIADYEQEQERFKKEFLGKE